jgi:hypothetical protein
MGGNGMITVNWKIPYLKAANPQISREQLALLAQSDNHKVRRRVAEHSNTPSVVLAQLSQDDHASVKLEAARNSAAPTEIALELAHDSDPTVRYGLAEDANISKEALGTLVMDENPYVSDRARKTLAAVCTDKRKRRGKIPVPKKPVTLDIMAHYLAGSYS